MGLVLASCAERQRAHTGSFACLLKTGVLGEVTGEDLNSIFISFLGVSLEGPGLY